MSRQRWMILIGAVSLIGAGAALTIGVTKMTAANSEFEGLRASITPLDGWILSAEDVRLAGLFGSCVTSAFDVRACPSSLDDYNIKGELTKEQLRELLESSGVEVSTAECEPTSTSDVKFGELCYAVGEKNGYPIKVSVVAGPNPNTSTNPWGRITVGR